MLFKLLEYIGISEYWRNFMYDIKKMMKENPHRYAIRIQINFTVNSSPVRIYDCNKIRVSSNFLNASSRKQPLSSYHFSADKDFLYLDVWLLFCWFSSRVGK